MTPLPHITIAPLAPGDLDIAADIAATAPDPWRRADLAGAIGDTRRICLGAYTGDSGAGHSLAGFICLRVLAGEAELEMLAVDPTARRQSIGKQLAQAGLGACKKAGATRCLLELRAGNAPALALYQALGFATLARRPALYAHPREDGLCMELAL